MKISIYKILSWFGFIMLAIGGFGISFIIFPVALYVYFTEGVTKIVVFDFIGIIGFLLICLFTNKYD